MGRPKYLDGEPTAHEKLTTAFWDALSEAPFSEMTVRSLCRRANVNHNTFYRHFESIEQLATEAFDEKIIRSVPQILLKESGNNHTQHETVAKIAEEDLQKALLYARSGSDFLCKIVRESIMNAWLEAAQVSRDNLTITQRIDCDILFGGIVTALSNETLSADENAMAALLSRPLGKGMIATMQEIATNKENIDR